MTAIIRKILSLLFLFVLFLGLVACNKDVVNENGEEKEGTPVKHPVRDKNKRTERGRILLCACFIFFSLYS
ncbi:hypothetical protein QFZ73_005812 [Peribacillus sp. V2I11]|nr:hypothetical protein [Peribacillus sp. V2I11]